MLNNSELNFSHKLCTLNKGLFPIGVIMKENIRKSTPYITAFCASILGMVLFFAVAFEISAFTTDEKSSGGRKLSELEPLWNFVLDNYYHELDENDLYLALADALFEQLDDPYSRYIPAEEIADSGMNDTILGNFGGVGAYIEKLDPSLVNEESPEVFQWLMVTELFEGGPAHIGGLHAGDFIMSVDGEDLTPLTSSESRDLIRGPVGSIVELEVYRDGEVLSFSIPRGQVEIETVSAALLPGNVGYVSVASFTPYTAEQMIAAVEGLERQGAKSYILDLRGNPGGHFGSSRDVADAFLSSGVIVSSSGRDWFSSLTYKADKWMVVPKSVPLVVMIDGGSASGSEVATGALKDNGRAYVVGSTSFGKGIVQSVRSYGDDQFTLTTAQYFTPNGDDIHGSGIEPHLTIEEKELSEEGEEYLISILEEQKITRFVMAHPEKDEAIIENFIQELESETTADIDRYLRLLIERSYQKYEDFSDVYNLDLDPVLQETLDLLLAGELQL